MDKKALMDQISKFPYWYHRIELAPGVITPGWAPVDPQIYRIPKDLSEKRVLDVGAWDGYWTFEALKRGAREVVAIDDFSDYLDRLKDDERRAWETFDFCKSKLGYDDTVCKRVEMSVYEANADNLGGTFDVVFFFGTLYHLRYPLLALDFLSGLCSGSIHIESAILDDYSPYRGGLGHGYGEDQMIMEFYPDREYGDNPTNWWCPTLACLKSMTSAAGFSQVRGWKLTETPDQPGMCRGFVQGLKPDASVGEPGP